MPCKKLGRVRPLVLPTFTSTRYVYLSLLCELKIIICDLSESSDSAHHGKERIICETVTSELRKMHHSGNEGDIRGTKSARRMTFFSANKDLGLASSVKKRYEVSSASFRQARENDAGLRDVLKKFGMKTVVRSELSFTYLLLFLFLLLFVELKLYSQISASYMYKPYVLYFPKVLPRTWRCLHGITRLHFDASARETYKTRPQLHYIYIYDEIKQFVHSMQIHN